MAAAHIPYRLSPHKRQAKTLHASCTHSMTAVTHTMAAAHIQKLSQHTRQPPTLHASCTSFMTAVTHASAAAHIPHQLYIFYDRLSHIPHKLPHHTYKVMTINRSHRYVLPFRLAHVLEVPFGKVRHVIRIVPHRLSESLAVLV